MFRSLILFTALGLSIASAKSYEIILDNAAKAGSIDLKPGKYNVAVMEDAKIRFTDAAGKAIEASATVSSADKKFQNTVVDTKQVNGTTTINEIDLGGTKTMIRFE